MAVRLVTDAERDVSVGFPRDGPPSDLLVSFTLSDADLDLIGDRRGDHNRLGYALQLKALLYLGFVPDDLSSAPSRAVADLALQLSVPSEALAEYGDRDTPGLTTFGKSRTDSVCVGQHADELFRTG